MSWRVCLLLLWLWLSGCSSPPKSDTPVASPTSAQAASPASAQTTAPQTAEQVRLVLEQAVKDAPTDPLPLLELALFDRQTNNPARAEQGLLDCWKRFPRFARAPYHLGMLYLAQGRDTLAAAPLRTAANLDKTDVAAQINAGLACQRAGLLPEARRFAQAALRLDPERADTYMLLARLDDSHGTARIALTYLDKYLKYSPDPAPGYYLKGRIYARLSDRTNAETWLRRAVQADPNNPDFWTTLGRVYSEMYGEARTQDGLQCFQKALELAPQHADTHRYLGLTLKRLQRHAEAVTHLQAALGGLKEPGPLYYDLGQSLMKAGRTQEGQAMLAKYREYRDYTSGVKRLNLALEKAPKDRARHHDRIRFCLKYRQYGAATIALREAVQTIGPDETLRGFLKEIETARKAFDAAQPGGNPTLTP